MNFTDRVILITGASDGIGKRLALDLAARGAVIIGCGRSEERLGAVLTELQCISPRSITIKCDVSSREEVRAMVRKVLAAYDAVDILINNAGIGMRKPFVETPDRKSTRLNSSHSQISYAVFCLKKKKK